MIPCSVVQAAICGTHQVHADTQYGRESCHRVETTVEAEYELIEIGWQMLRADAMVSCHQPSLQIREGNMDHRQVSVGFLAIATMGSCAYPNLVSSS